MITSPAKYSTDIKTLTVTSDAFKDRTYIPTKYTYDGENINPPLKIENIPHEAKSLVLIVEDVDAPEKTWVHWLVWNITPSGKIKENTVPGIEGISDFRHHHYSGPCPPVGTHHYYFKIYALDDLLNLNTTITKPDLEKAMSTHIIGYGQLVGTYKRVL
jgi:Raf kinase inhibitor-like YbhB/YbcL family protein